MTTALQHLSKDPILASVIARVKLAPLSKTTDVYVALLGSIISQQLSIKAAATIEKRFLALFPDEYPDPGMLLEMPEETLRSVGLSRQKALYMKNVADFALVEGLSYEMLKPMEVEDFIKYVTRIKGVGRWTAEMLLMFVLESPDVFPVDDLGIQIAIKKLYGLEQEGKALKAEMHRIGEAWRPYRTLACLYLWRWKDS